MILIAKFQATLQATLQRATSFAGRYSASSSPRTAVRAANVVACAVFACPARRDGSLSLALPVVEQDPGHGLQPRSHHRHHPVAAALGLAGRTVSDDAGKVVRHRRHRRVVPGEFAVVLERTDAQVHRTDAESREHTHHSGGPTPRDARVPTRHCRLFGRRSREYFRTRQGMRSINVLEGLIVGLVLAAVTRRRRTGTASDDGARSSTKQPAREPSAEHDAVRPRCAIARFGLGKMGSLPCARRGANHSGQHPARCARSPFPLPATGRARYW